VRSDDETPGHVRVRYAKKQVKDAPSIDTDGELPAGAEDALFTHYDLPLPGNHEPAAAVGRRRSSRPAR